MSEKEIPANISFHMAEEMLKLIIENMPLVCNMCDKDFNIIFCNRATADLFGLADQNDYISLYDELSPPFQPDGVPSREKALALMADCFENGAPLTFEWLHNNLQGEIIPTEVTLIRVKLETDYCIVAFKRDLREFFRYRVTQEMAKQRLQTMMDASPLACFIVDEHFNVLEANKEVARLFSLESKQVFIDRFFELSATYQPDGRLSKEKMLEKLDYSYETGGAHFEWLHRNLKGECLPCEISLVRVRLEERNLIVAYIRDLREIKDTVAMVEQLEAIGADALEAP